MAITRLPLGAFDCHYNGVTWGPSAETTFFSVKPNLDPAGRTVVSATYTITVVETIADATTTSPIILDKIARLSRNAGRLRYKGRGFGDLNLNIAGGLVGGLGKRDVKWGPHTKEISCEPTGAGKAVKITWTVEFTTVNCPDGLTASGTVLQFTYTVGYEIDRAGYTTRTYEASLTIAQTKRKVDHKTLDRAADEHLEKMTPELTVQFRRESQSRRLSLDKCTLTLVVRDVQMPQAAPPDGVVEAEAEHAYTSDGWYKWSGVITATYDLARVEGTPEKAIQAFFGLCRDRIAEARKMVFDVPGRGLRVPVTVVPLNFSASEPNVYGRKQVRLGMKYLVAAATFGELLRSGGLWRPFAEMAGAKGWKEWVASVPTALSPRGHADLRFDPKEDAIVDACVPGAKVQVPFTNGTPNQQQIVTQPVSLFALLGAVFPPPAKENSWIGYRNAITVHPDTGRVVGTTLPSLPLTAGQRSAAFDALATQLPSIDGAATGVFGTLDGVASGDREQGGGAFVHQRTRPVNYVTMTGTALRAGWQIPMPELVAANGARPVLVGQPWFRQEIVREAQVPIVRADWSLTYVFTEDGGVPRGAVPTPPSYGRA